MTENKIIISCRLLLAALYDNSYGRDECSLIELSGIDFDEISKLLEPMLTETINRWSRDRLVRLDGSFKYIDPVIIADRFLFHGAIVLKSQDVEAGKIRTFNKNRFMLKLLSFEEIAARAGLNKSNE